LWQKRRKRIVNENAASGFLYQTDAYYLTLSGIKSRNNLRKAKHKRYAHTMPCGIEDAAAISMLLDSIEMKTDDKILRPTKRREVRLTV
jgi:hypothetical protein